MILRSRSRSASMHSTLLACPQRGCRVARVGQIREGVVAVSEWPLGFCPLHVNASEPSVPGGFSTFPRPSPPPSSFAFAHLCSLLPPRSVRYSRCVGQKGIRCGKCSGTDLSGRRCEGVRERYGARFGRLTVKQHGLPPTGSDRRGLVIVWRRTVGSRCQPGLRAAQGWHREEENRHDKRRGTPRGPCAQRTHIPRVVGEQRACAIGGQSQAKSGEGGPRRRKAFLWSLASDKASSAPKLLRGSARAAWYRRWSSLLACSAAKAFATSLLEQRGSPGAGGRLPSVQEVLCDARREVA